MVTPPAPAPARLLVCSVNWLGDAIMAMPALQALHEKWPKTEVSILTKPGLAPLWALHEVPNQVFTMPKGTFGLLGLAKPIKNMDFEVSYILPHSFRSALPPFLAKIPQRIGFPGHFPRDFMLTEVRPPAGGAGRIHQVFEYLDLFFPGENRQNYPQPRLTVPETTLTSMRDKLSSLPKPWIAILPGAARGPAKQWPAENYAKTAALLVAQTGGSVITLGTASERAVCQQVAASAAPNGLNLAGSTTLPELAAVLALANVVLCNDSGGMHLAAALGTPLVAIFGITNPQQTGPIGQKIRILQQSDQKTRDIPRKSQAAAAALRSISPAEALQATLDLLAST